MKKGLRIAIAAGAAVLLALVIFLMLKMNGAKRSQLTCGGVKVEFADDFNFLDARDIENCLKDEYGSYVGQLLDSVDLSKVEGILDGKSPILKAEAYTTPDGLLNVRIYQRKPVVRFQKGTGGFYADSEGFLFPLQENFTSSVPVIDGDIPLSFESGYRGEPKTEKEKEWLAGTIELVNFIKDSKTWSEIISQISVTKGGDFVMVPRQGKEKFIFGPPVDIAGKFDRLGKYYTNIVPAKGEGHYSTVNVKFAGQIVCRK